MGAVNGKTKSVGVVVRESGTGAEKAAAFVSHFARAAFAEDERYRVANLASVLDEAASRPSIRAFAVAEKSLAKGREAFTTMDLDVAVEHLDGALTKYERHVDALQDVSKVTDALMLLGGTHLLRGETRTGVQRIKQALAINPQLEPDPQIFNPDDRKTFSDAAQALLSRPKGDLSITSNPSYAEVYVDGRFAGVTPLALEGLAEGRHYVRVVKDGLRSWGKVLDVKGGKETSSTASLRATKYFDDFDMLTEDGIAGLARGDEEGAGAEAAEQLGVRFGGLDFLFLAEVELDGERVEVSGFLYDLNANNRIIRRGKQTFSYDSRPDTYRGEVKAMYNKFFSERPTVAGIDGLGGDGRGIDVNSGVCFGMSCGKFRTYTLVGGGGGGLALMGLGTLFWVLADADNDKFKDAFQLSQESADLEQSGKVKAMVGDISFFLGAATVVTAGLLYLFYMPSPSAQDVLNSGQGGWNFELQATPTKGGAAVGALWRF